ncbi:MAG: hypothetical protein ACLQVN_16655 [Bryobacteraceae bacterium]
MSMSTQISRNAGVTLAAALLVMAALAALPLAGQEFRGTIAGTITDQTGAAIANASIEVRGTDTTYHSRQPHQRGG